MNSARAWAGKAVQRIRTFVQSIRFRLSLWSAAIVAVILLLFSLFVYSRQALDLQINVQNRLALQTHQLQEIYRMSGLFAPDGAQFQAPDLTGSGSALVQEQALLALVKADGTVLQTVGGIDKATISQAQQYWQQNSQGPQPIAFTAVGHAVGTTQGNGKYVFLATPIFIDRNYMGLILLGEPVDPVGQLPKLVVTLLLGSLATLGLAVAGGYWLAGRAMAPVRTITRTARGISETDLHRRLRLGTKDELGELADTFDAMLDRLQAAFDRQRQFTADASHELRTPLTIVGLEASHALEKRRAVEDYERALQVIQSENEYMAHLVNDLLTLARMDAGQTHLGMESLDLSDVALDVAERLSPIAHRDGVEMTTGELPEVAVHGDRQYLTQMLTNLVENAIKYAGGRGRHVRVETGSRMIEDRSFSWVKVEDDGPGIAPEYLPHLFDRFYRVDQARTRQPNEGQKDPEGSGLGLSIVQWIAQAHGGRVVVWSEAGKGSVFEVALPAAADERSASSGLPGKNGK